MSGNYAHLYFGITVGVIGFTLIITPAFAGAGPSPIEGEGISLLCG